MTSSSARDARNILRQRIQAYNLPAPPIPITAPDPDPISTSIPELKICDQYGDPTLDSTLRPLARALILLDNEMLKRVQKFHKKRGPPANEIHRTRITVLLKTCDEIKWQWKAIDSGNREFTDAYMKSKQLIPVWAESMKIMKEALRGNQISHQDKKRDDYDKILHKCDTLANEAMNHMLDVARQGLLESAAFDLIQERWLRLDELLNWYYDLRYSEADEPGEYISRISLTWREAQRLIQQDEVTIKSDKKQIQLQPADSVRRERENDVAFAFIGSDRFSAFIFWSAFFTCVVISTVLFALGYGRSLHHRGTTDDPDFWFLIQATCIQLLGLVVSALVEHKRGRLPKWRWCLPTAIAGASAIGSIPLYIFFPKEWSSFLSAIAGATQTFMTLQYLLF